jgi:hypothetical protein
MKKLKVSYIKHNKEFLLLYLGLSALLVMTNISLYEQYFTIPSIVLVICSVVIGLPFLVDLSGKKKLPIEQLTLEVHSGRIQYYLVKLSDILLQQIVIILLIYTLLQITDTFTAVILFTLIFALAHLKLFFEKTISHTMLFLVPSIFAAPLFFSIYTNFIPIAFGLSFTAHLFYYVVLSRKGLVKKYSLRLLGKNVQEI